MRCSFSLHARKGARGHASVTQRHGTRSCLESFVESHLAHSGASKRRSTHILLPPCGDRSPPCAFARLARAAAWVARIKTDVPSYGGLYAPRHRKFVMGASGCVIGPFGAASGANSAGRTGKARSFDFSPPKPLTRPGHVEGFPWVDRQPACTVQTLPPCGRG